MTAAAVCQLLQVLVSHSASTDATSSKSIPAGPTAAQVDTKQLKSSGILQLITAWQQQRATMLQVHVGQ